MFQHTAARRRLVGGDWLHYLGTGFNTQPPEGGCARSCKSGLSALFQHTAARRRLATRTPRLGNRVCFNTQPPEGGCYNVGHSKPRERVSTHSRPKAAAPVNRPNTSASMFQHTAARRRLLRAVPKRPIPDPMFQHTAARRRLLKRSVSLLMFLVSTHSRPKAADPDRQNLKNLFRFQHTAARRRLLKILCLYILNKVSTHSRPKAAEA